MRIRRRESTARSMSVATVYKGCFALAAIDIVVSVILAVNGDIRFVPMMFLAGFMWLQGMYFKAKEDCNA